MCVCVGAYRSVEAVAVVVQLSCLFKKIELDPVVEPGHFSLFDFTCNTDTLDLYSKFKYKYFFFFFTVICLTCEDVFKSTGVQHVVVA